jgi:iron-sulfur cluster assembly accessory protein
VKPNIILSSRAIEAAKEFAKLAQYRGKHLRVYLCGKDCDGFLYGVNFDDTIEGDETWIQDGVSLTCDHATLEVCDGATVDFVDAEYGRGFLVENPNQGKYQGKFWKKGSPEEHHDH